MGRIALFAFVLAGCQVDSPTLSQTVQQTVVLLPSSSDFGSLQVGQMSGSAYLDINPSAGNQYDTITSITASCPDFVISAPGLPTDVYRVCEYTTCDPKYGPCELAQAPVCTTTEYVNYRWSAVFRPTVAGATSCVVNILLNGSTLRTVTLSGMGTVPPKDIDVSPTNVAFGDVRKDTSSTPVGLTVRNAGGIGMTVYSAGVSAGFAIASGTTSQYGLAAGASMSYSVTCNPTATTTMNGSFVVQSDDPSTPTVTIPLTCRGIDSAVALTPSPTTLTTTRVGEPVQTTVQIQNSGAASMVLEGVSVTGTDLMLMSAPANGTYATGAVGGALVRFGATAKGTQTGMLTVTYDGGKTRTSTISARAMATSMALSPDGDVDFGPVCAGQTQAQSFTILANEEASFQVTQLGGVVPPFTLTSPTLPVTVAGSGATMVQFSVTAAPTAEGIQVSELNLATNIPGSAPRTINLSVDALPAGVSPSPMMIDFGSVPAMSTTIGQSVHLSNCSTTAANFTNARIEGADASEFAIVAQPETSTIGPNGNASWLVVLTTKTAGLKHAEFMVDYEGGTAIVALDGEGLGDDVIDEPGGPIDEISYYSCSAAGGSTSRAWPLVLVLGIVLRRRRRR